VLIDFDGDDIIIYTITHKEVVAIVILSAKTKLLIIWFTLVVARAGLPMAVLQKSY